MSSNLIIELLPRTDRKGKKFYIGKLEAPVLIDCKDGVSFLVFVSEDGVEQIQIAGIKKDSKNDKYEEVDDQPL